MQSRVHKNPAARAVEAVRGSGKALPAHVQQRATEHYGFSFDDVRVHDEPAAHGAAGSLHVAAYFIGSDGRFAYGRYDPGSERGDVQPKHELRHVAQQQWAAAARSPQVDPADSLHERDAREPTTAQAPAMSGQRMQCGFEEEQFSSRTGLVDAGGRWVTKTHHIFSDAILNTIGATYDSHQRLRYTQAFEQKAKIAIKKISSINRANLTKIRAIVREASEFRDTLRTATQKTLTPWGEYMSRRIEGFGKKDFDIRLVDHAKKLQVELKRVPTQFEVLESVAKGVGKSNRWVSRVAFTTRIVGPVAIIGQVAMIGSNIYNAKPENRVQVAGTEGFRLSASLLYGSLGSVAAVAGVGLLLMSPVGPIIAGYAGITYMIAAIGGTVAGGYVGSVVADKVLGEK